MLKLIANNIKRTNSSYDNEDFENFSSLFGEVLQEKFQISSPSSYEEINPLRIRQVETEKNYFLNTEDLAFSNNSYQIPWIYLSKSSSNKTIISESLELEKLKNLLKYPVFKKDEQIKIWKRFRRLINRSTPNLWIYYFEIDELIYIFFVDNTSRFDLIFKSVESQFPKLYLKYYLKVKEISNKPIKTF